MRRLAVLGLVCVAAVLSCGKDVTGPLGAAGRYARDISWNAIFPPAFQAVGGTSSGVVQISTVHVVLLHTDGTVALDTTIDFPADSTSLTLSLTVKLLNSAPATGEPMSLDLGYLDAAGNTVFMGGPVAITAAPPPAGGGGNPPVQVRVSYTGTGAGAAAVVISPRAATATAGAAFSFTAVAKDASGTAIPGTPVIWNSLDPAIATVTSAAAGTGVAQNQRGTARIVAQLLTGPADTVVLTVALPGAQIAAQSGNAQTGVVGATLTQPLVVKVAASDGVGVAGTTVTFAVATGGGSVANASVVSDASGLAQTTWKLGTGSGAQSVTATAGTLANSPLTFIANAQAATATKLVVTTQPVNGAAGTALTAVVVSAEDDIGNVATGFTGPVTVAFGTSVAGAKLGGTATVNAVAGVATFSALTVSKNGTGYTLVASGTGLTSATTGAFDIAVGAPAKLAFAVGPADGVASVVMNPAIVVNAEDSQGNVTTAFTGAVTLGFALNPTGATLGGTATATAVAGVATFAGISVSLPGSGYALSAAATGLTSGTSALFSIASNGSPARTWTGATNNQWATATNWSPAGVPAATDSVIVPVTSTPPTLAASATVADLSIAAGATLTIAGPYTLTDNGALDALGGILGTGNVAITGSTAVRGIIVGNLTVTGNYSLLNALTVTGNVVVSAGGLSLNGHPVTVTGNFSTTGTGALTMNNSADVLAVSGTASFAGGSTSGRLTNGLISVEGATFTQGGTASAFAPSGSNTVAFVGTSPQTITIANPSSSWFQNFVGGNTAGVTIASNIAIQGNVTLAGPVTTGTYGLSINGTLSDPAGYLSTVEISFGGSTTPVSAATPTINASVTFNHNPSILQGSLTINGATFVLGNLQLAGQSLFANGKFATMGSGQLTMTNAGDSLFVSDSAQFAGGNEGGILTNGVLFVYSGISVAGAHEFSATGAHTTWLVGNTGEDCDCDVHDTHARNMTRAAWAALVAQRKAAMAPLQAKLVPGAVAMQRAAATRGAAIVPSGPSPAGTRARRLGGGPKAAASPLPITPTTETLIAVAFADTTGNSFASVHVLGAVDWQLPARVAGNMLLDTAGADIAGCGHIILGGTLVGSPGGSIEVEAFELAGTGPGTFSDSGTFTPDTTIWSGTNELMPSTVSPGQWIDWWNVVVNSPSLRAYSDSAIYVGASLFVQNSGRLRLGYAGDSTEMDINGALETHQSGTLQMNDDVRTYLWVSDSAWFDGGSTTGLLTSGEIYYYWNFRQSGASTSYAATSPHQSYFGAYEGTQTVTFANPATGAGGSHFGDLYLGDPTTVVTSSVFADGQLQTGHVASHIVQAAVTGFSLTSKGADVRDLEFDHVTWSLMDGYDVTDMDEVDFENQSTTATQFSVQRNGAGSFAAMTNWTFGTTPTAGGLYISATDTDGSTNGYLTLNLSGTYPSVSGGFIAMVGGAIISGF
jgi:hypothetical protein